MKIKHHMRRFVACLTMAVAASAVGCLGGCEVHIRPGVSHQAEYV